MNKTAALLAVVVCVALMWAWAQERRASRAHASLAAMNARIVRDLNAQDRLSRSDRELLDALHEQAEAQRRHEEMARKGMLPDLGGMGVTR